MTDLIAVVQITAAINAALLVGTYIESFLRRSMRNSGNSSSR
jgi:hypothetical protein